MGDLQPLLFRPPVLDPMEPDDLTDMFIKFFLSSYVLNQLLICNIKISLRDYYSHVFCVEKYFFHTYTHTYIYNILNTDTCIGATRGCVPTYHHWRQLSGDNIWNFVLRNGAETLNPRDYNTIDTVLQILNYTMLWFFTYINYNTITYTKLMYVLG